MRSNYRQREKVMRSSGPDGTVRGTRKQIVEKYDALAHEADVNKDRVLAEQYRQHAEHYRKEF